MSPQEIKITIHNIITVTTTISNGEIHMVEINSGLDFNAIINQTFLRPIQLLQTLKPTFNRLQSYNYKFNHHEFFVEHRTFGENPKWGKAKPFH